MAREEKTFEIDGHSYTIVQVGAREGRRLWLKLLKSLAPALSEVAKHKDVDLEALAGGFATIIENLDESVAEELYEAFGATCRVHLGDKTPFLKDGIFDEHFAGRYVPMTKWLGACVLFNFGSFFDVSSLGNILASARATVSKSVSPKGSTGSSSES